MLTFANRFGARKTLGANFLQKEPTETAIHCCASPVIVLQPFLTLHTYTFLFKESKNRCKLKYSGLNSIFNIFKRGECNAGIF